MNRSAHGPGHTASAAPPNYGDELEARRAQRLATAEAFRRGRTPLQIVAATQAAAAAADAAAARPRVPPAACREGCAWCCYKPVGTAAPEVLRIVDYLRETLTAEAWAALLRRLFDDDARGRSPRPCPLLVGDRCIAYPVRPLTCRGFNSGDARRCEQSLTPGRSTEVPVHLPQLRLATFVLDGLRAGLGECGLDGARLALAAALRIALRVPDAREQWLAGGAVFAPARMA